MTDHLRNRIAKALEREDSLNCGYDHSFVNTYGIDPETDGFVDAVLAALLTGAEREPRTRLDDLTSDQLDDLYDDLDRYGEILGEMNERVVEQAKEIDQARDDARSLGREVVRWHDIATRHQHWGQRRWNAWKSARRRAQEQQEKAVRAEDALARTQALADEHPAGIDTALILEALDQTQAPANPPGSTVEQLPSHVLALLPTHPYLSTACQTADAVAITAVRGLPLYDELRAHAERLHARCRLNHKFTGQLCTCGCHPEPAPVPATAEATDTTGPGVPS